MLYGARAGHCALNPDPLIRPLPENRATSGFSLPQQTAGHTHTLDLSLSLSLSLSHTHTLKNRANPFSSRPFLYIEKNYVKYGSRVFVEK